MRQKCFYKERYTRIKNKNKSVFEFQRLFCPPFSTKQITYTKQQRDPSKNTLHKSSAEQKKRKRRVAAREV